MRPFHIYKRRSGIYYAKAIEIPTGRILCTRSTGTRDHFEAMLFVAEWKKNGEAQNIKMFSESSKEMIFGELGKIDFSVPENKERLLQFVQNTVGIAFTRAENSQHRSGVDTLYYSKKLKNDISGKKLVEYLVDFWTPDKSKYIRDRRARGKKIGERHCYEMRNRAKNYWFSYFGETVIGDIDNEDLSDFFLDLRETRNLSGSTINNVMNTGVVALKWAYEHKMLSENITEGVERFAVDNRERGILTESEAQRLFALEWKDNRAKAANLLAMTTGMRAGEILALRPCDIKDTYIELQHSWNDKDGLKSPKNGKARKVPLVAQMRSILLQLASSNPHGVSPTNFIFYSTLADRPVVINVLIDNLILELEKIGISEAERQDRNIVFHSWRHYYATQITKRVQVEQAQQALGHLTPEMTKHYADHKTIEDLEVIGRAVQEAFANVVNFSGIT